MNRAFLPALAAAAIAAALLAPGAQTTAAREERLARLRNLGKAFYENPTTQAEAVEQFRRALEINDSTRERLNYGLSLLRAGKTEEGVAELLKVQQADPSLPYTWFNLGIVYKKAGEFDKATAQFQRMVALRPDEPISHYNLGTLYKLANKLPEAIAEFETAIKLDGHLAAPHFQLFNTYRQAGRMPEAQKELALFQTLKKAQEGSATPEDMEWCDYAEIWDPIDPHRPATPVTRPVWKDRKLDVKAEGLALLDADNDGRADLLAWSSTSVAILRNGATPMAQPELAKLTGVTGVYPADFNNDGWADLLVLTGAGPRLFRNDKGRFVADPLTSTLPKGNFATAAWIDFDHDYDLDLVLLGDTSVLMRNQGAAGFHDQTAAFPFAKGRALAAEVFRTVADTKGIDLLVSYADHAGVLYRDRLTGSFEAVEVPELAAGTRRMRAMDLDDDSQIDVLLGEKQWLKNVRARFTAMSTEPPRQEGWLTADFDGQGRPSQVYVAADGFAHRNDNVAQGKNNWIGVQLTGVKNLLLAAGAEVEIKSGLVYQKQVYSGLPLVFQLGPETQADTVRISWANGLIQNEMKQPAGKVHNYKEAQRLSGSCPVIWTWNGHEFEYITDVLGVAPLGASSGDGKYFPVDHDEYVAISARSLQPVNGRYRIRITEELSEVSYLDHVQLIAVDHPANVDVFSNEKWKSPPFPEFRLYGVERRIYPAQAHDQLGRDVRERLLRTDKAYVDTFQRNFSGVAEMHSLTLDFGRESARDNRAVLVLNGWVDWADGSTFLAASQETPQGLVTPYLQVKDAQGQWRTVIQDLGMPSGKPKTIAVDLTGKFLSESREVRIVTNMCVFWDEIFLGESSAAPAGTRLTPMQAARADLHFRGFSRNHVHPQRKQPEFFTYPDPEPVSLWNPTPGLYTRYGPVTELITTGDNKLAILGSGDELALEFDAAQLPPLAAGHRRDFLLLVDGWAKDRDANTAFSQSVEPLPFREMSSYPYPPGERYPDTPELRAWREQYNTRPALRLIRPLVRTSRAD